MNRIPFQPEPRRPPLRCGEGAALIELGQGVAADFVRMGGDKCPLCGGAIASDDWVQEGRTITQQCNCESCEFKCTAVFKLTDAEV